LRAIVRQAIERHMPPQQLQKLKAAEAREKRTITKLVKSLRSPSR
jgi:hypothetical protein